ncbi:MAG: hypothetical protein HOO67_01675 [Candidatus Peribacteraceae bacterium]|nr:hypothetical protein [Candidatus Peribacteraceae bacterium]
MLRPLQQLSAFFFYLLGSSFFVAYILLKNKLWMNDAALWMQIADLPLAFCALSYGGLSLYLSVRTDESKMLPWLIGVPLGIFFVMIVVMNFWPA